MSPIAYFGIESSGLSLAIDLLILFLVVLYGSLVYWTYADARRRIADPVLVGCAAVASLILPFVGTIVYMIVRPPEYLEDVRERELDLQAAEARLHELDHSLCPHCDYRVERDFIRCPSCLRKLKDRCESCSKPLDRAWTICPYCEAEVKSAKPARRTRRESATGRSAEPPARSRRKSSETEIEVEPIEPIGTVEEIEFEPRPPRRRAGSAAVRAPETTSLLSDEPAQEDPGLSGQQNGTAEPVAEPPKRRSSRPRASE
ncbi:MAG TPA: zinc ribbon domain-containing protein [Solirubrobacteraceae bacterium]|nr:zinc ribbon domain-containing protein [Solirubrobacteraceae bacterium]